VKDEKRDLDAWFPLRHMNRALEIFKKILGKNQLTTGNAIGFIAWWFGTGQGSLTSEFAEEVGFITNPADLIVKIQKVWGNKSVKYDNPSLFGSCARAISFSKGKPAATFDDVKSNILQWFSDDLQNRWKEFLAKHGMLNQDYEKKPTTISWSDGFQFIVELSNVSPHIPGFGGGVMAMQMANTLSYIGLFQRSTIKDMAFFAASKPDLGAVSGLKHLGFPLEEDAKANRQAIHLAMTFSFSWVNTNLSKSRLQKMNYGSDTHENLLCKLSKIVSLKLSESSA
jgi:hypothetical protein